MDAALLPPPRLVLLGCVLLSLASGSGSAQEAVELRRDLEQMLGDYFARPEPDDSLARKIGALSSAHEELLVEVLDLAALP